MTSNSKNGMFKCEFERVRANGRAYERERVLASARKCESSVECEIVQANGRASEGECEQVLASSSAARGCTWQLATFSSVTFCHHKKTLLKYPVAVSRGALLIVGPYVRTSTHCMVSRGDSLCPRVRLIRIKWSVLLLPRATIFSCQRQRAPFTALRFLRGR